MKKLFALFVLLPLNILFCQLTESQNIFSTFHLGVYGGINFEPSKYFGQLLQIEGKSNLSENLFLKISAGYSREYSEVHYRVKSYSKVTIENTDVFIAGSYDVNKEGYDKVPILIGLQYIVLNGKISPYIIGQGGYNLLSLVVYKTNHTSLSYSSAEEIPDEFKHPLELKDYDNSLSYSMGVGTYINLSSTLSLDLRYIYQFDSEIVNTHQILFGIALQK